MIECRHATRAIDALTGRDDATVRTVDFKVTAAKPDSQDCFNRAAAIAVQSNQDVAAARYKAQVLMVSAVAARKAGESEEAIELLHKASLLEEKDVLVSGPQDIIKPTSWRGRCCLRWVGSRIGALVSQRRGRRARSLG